MGTKFKICYLLSTYTLLTYTLKLQTEEGIVLYILLLLRSQKVSEVSNCGIAIYLQSTVKPLLPFLRSATPAFSSCT